MRVRDTSGGEKRSARRYDRGERADTMVPLSDKFEGLVSHGSIRFPRERRRRNSHSVCVSLATKRIRCSGFSVGAALREFT